MKAYTIIRLIALTIIGFWALVLWTSIKAQTNAPALPVPPFKAPTPAPVGPYLVKPTCLPMTGNFRIKHNIVGICCRWNCPDKTFWTYCGTWAAFATSSAKINTIQKASDPLFSLQQAGMRFKIVPLTDPSMAGLPKDF